MTVRLKRGRKHVIEIFDQQQLRAAVLPHAEESVSELPVKRTAARPAARPPAKAAQAATKARVAKARQRAKVAGKKK
jgi:hypothetical protein